MEEVIKKCMELYKALQDAIATVATRLRNVVKRENAVEDKQNFQDGREKNLDAREIETKKVEDVVALAASAKKMTADAKTEFAKLETAKTEHQAKVQKNVAESNRERERLAEKENGLIIREKNLKIGQEQLEKDKKEYKAKILEELKGKVT